VDKSLVVTNDARIEQTAIKTHVECAAIVGAQISRAVVARDHQTKRVLPSLTRGLHGEIGIDNRARVHGRDRRLKNLDAFEKERSFLREEDRETLVCGDYELIRLYLREVRIDGQIDCHSGTRNELGGQSEIETNRFVHDASGVDGALR